MKTRLWFLAAPAVILALGTQSGLAQPPKGNPEEEAALLRRAEAFVEAYHRGDAKAVASFWTPDGDYTDRTGRQHKGRDAIEKAFQSLFAENKGLKLRIDIASLRFVTPDVAVEDGTTAVIPPDRGPPSRARYTIVHVKNDGQWYLASVRDAPFTAATNYERLRALEWLIGDWVDETEGGEATRASFSWAENQNFIVSSFATTFKKIELGSGTQWIGWDPLGKQIRSWTFDASGGFGEGSWSRDGGKLIVKSITVLPDGKKVTATNVVTRLDADTVRWQSQDRTADGKPLPDIPEIKLKRLK
jgi:uncharacterized protein (TIGR02246 family)